ncbi:hypothetical protein ACLB2K_053054 [Fragaria x ananassa]
MVDSKGMVKTEDVKSFIKPLNGKDDFTLWRRRMKSVLILQDLYEAVLWIENKAVDMADKVWQKMDKKARSTIELHLADHVLGRVLDSGSDNMSSKETWDYLEKVYAGKGSIGENMDSSKTLDNGINFELNDEMVSEDEEREAMQDIINNTKLSEDTVYCMQKYLADILSVLALTISAEGERESLQFRLLGSDGNVHGDMSMSGT